MLLYKIMVLLQEIDEKSLDIKYALWFSILESRKE